MSAVDYLLTRLGDMERASAAITDPGLPHTSIGDYLMRGIAVDGLICVETFLKQRIREWVHVIESSRIAPNVLPGGTQHYEDRILEVLPRRIRDTTYAGIPQRSALLQEIGQSLTSLNSGAFTPHQMAFMWAGSNVQPGDIEAIVNMVSAKKEKAWSDLTSIWTLVDQHAPLNSSLKGVFEDIVETRHAAAHSNSLATPILNLRALARNVRVVCLCVDVLVSRRLREMCRSGPRGQPTATARPAVRKIIKDGSTWPEYGPDSGRAVRRHPSLAEAKTEAIKRATPDGQLVLVLDRAGGILDWHYPVL